MLAGTLLIIAAIGTLASTVFLGLALVAAWRYRAAVRAEHWPGATPPVSVLKPLHGREERLRENLAGYFAQDYPDYELLFCARSENDAGLDIARALAAEHPRVRVRFLTCGDPPFANAKVHSLATMAEAAAAEILILSDSDVPAAPDYVRIVSAPLREARVGAVTCLYRGLPVADFWARLEGLGMTVEMSAGVLIARMLEGMKFALGPTLALRKDVLAAIGGLRQFGDFCADDFLIGNLTAKAGYEVLLSAHVIDHQAGDRGLWQSFSHQARWMRSTRYSRPKGHFGTGLTFAVPFGLLGLLGGWLAGYPALGAGLFAWSLLNRVVLALVIGGTLGDRRAVTGAWLYPLRDLLGFFVWLASYAGNELVWRGERYRLALGGRMIKVSSAAGS